MGVVSSFAPAYAVFRTHSPGSGSARQGDSPDPSFPGDLGRWRDSYGPPIEGRAIPVEWNALPSCPSFIPPVDFGSFRTQVVPQGVQKPGIPGQVCLFGTARP